MQSTIEALLKDILKSQNQSFALKLTKHHQDKSKHRWVVVFSGHGLDIQTKAKIESFFSSHKQTQLLRNTLAKENLSLHISFTNKGNTQQKAATGNATSSSYNQPSHLAQDIGKIYCIASGKGGVGKSSVATALALGLAQKNQKVGLLDADIHGPSIPTLLDIQEAMEVKDGAEKILPHTKHGIRCVSFGFLCDGDHPVMWRGPMLSKALEQFLFHVEWGKLDYLIIDLPPGTGDIPMSLAENIALDGVWIVTTAHPIALIDAQKAISMFERLQVPVLGVIGNMLRFYCEKCEHPNEVFGSVEALHDLVASRSLSLSAELDLRPASSHSRPASSHSRPASSHSTHMQWLTHSLEGLLTDIVTNG